MSRIHDALRRAEQEKGKPRIAEAPAAAAAATPRAAPAEESHASPGTGAAIAAASLVELPAPAAPPRPAATDLLASCRRPLWSGDASKLLLQGSAGHSVAAEQLRHLRSRLTEMRARRALKTVVIASSMPGEGKTFLAANLAHAFARQHDRRILLVDADLRSGAATPGRAFANPHGTGCTLHTLLGAPAAPGLSEYLHGAATEEQVLQRGPQGNLFFIPSGKTPPNPGESFAGNKLKNLFARLAPLFDWILLDSPPVVDPDRGRAVDPDRGRDALPVAFIAGECDGVLLVIHAGGTLRVAAQHAAREFPRERLLGVVLNQTAPR